LSSTAIAEQFYSFDDDSHNWSPVYRDTLKFPPPSAIAWEGNDWLNSARRDLRNSASFIGTVDGPIKRVNSTNANGAYTMLEVKSPQSSKRVFRIELRMWDQMAEISIKHLRPNDLIYVSGYLSLYNIINKNGEYKTNYQLNAEKINYVMQGQKCPKDEQSRPKDESDAEKHKHQLRLWQSFFTYPNDWWDNRRHKRYPKQEFKHKITGEVLMISSEDPPWIKRQLELYDSRSIRKVGEASPMTFRDFGQG
jgi:single-stranded DNA-binding protein